MPTSSSTAPAHLESSVVRHGRGAYPVQQYLSRHASLRVEPVPVLGEYVRALIVPACAESPELLGGYAAAAAAAPGRTLCILVINAAEDASVGTHAANAHCLEALRWRLAPVRPVSLSCPAILGSLSHMDVLVLDGASPGQRLPRRQGVGLARRLGCDLALALWHSGQLREPWLYNTDADATLPATYFTAQHELLTRAPSVLLYPFRHQPSSDLEVNLATWAHELRLRHYVAGLEHAGSPYALHTIGSTLAIHAKAYAAVRGFPKRRAGEDFHILAKLLKVAPAERLHTEPIMLASRRSTRTPFGTGSAVEGWLDSSAPKLLLYHPACFSVLAQWLAALNDLAEHRDERRFQARLGLIQEPARRVVLQYWESIDGPAALRAALLQAPSSLHLKLRLHQHFDALRSLRLIHALRDTLYPSLPWQSALGAAAWGEGLESSTLEEALLHLTERERSFGAQVGP